MNSTLSVTSKAPAKSTPAQLYLKIGRLNPVPVFSADHASRIWMQYRDGLCLGASDSPDALLKMGGATVGYVSYNGRVWKGRPNATLMSKAPIAEPAIVKGVQGDDWIYVEDLMEERGKMMRVVDVYYKERAITLEDPSGQMCDRIYVREREGHDRFFCSFRIENIPA